jgi:hypothetical protein
MTTSPSAEEGGGGGGGGELTFSSSEDVEADDPPVDRNQDCETWKFGKDGFLGRGRRILLVVQIPCDDDDDDGDNDKGDERPKECVVLPLERGKAVTTVVSMIALTVMANNKSNVVVGYTLPLSNFIFLLSLAQNSIASLDCCKRSEGVPYPFHSQQKECMMCVFHS